MAEVERAEEGRAAPPGQVHQLETALASRVLIEQAKRTLAVRHGLHMQTAFDLLRAAARSNHLILRDLAARVVGEPSTPTEILNRLNR